MYITVKDHTSTGHRLMNHKGKCRNAHGHNYLLTFDFYGPDLDEETGMVADFSLLKQLVKESIDIIDHAMVLNIEDKDFIKFLTDTKQKVVVMGNEPTCEQIGRFLFVRTSDALMDRADLNVVLSRITISETPNFSAEIELSDIPEDE